MNGTRVPGERAVVTGGDRSLETGVGVGAVSVITSNAAKRAVGPHQERSYLAGSVHELHDDSVSRQRTDGYLVALALQVPQRSFGEARRSGVKGLLVHVPQIVGVPLLGSKADRRGRELVDQLRQLAEI